VTVALQIQGDAIGSEVTSVSRWIAPGSMSDKASKVCEEERSEVLGRTDQILNPPANP
jgi:hypothetical protein